MTVPSLLILGTDAVLAAAPATPVQLAHACLAAGYQAVIPASWGDELIAAHTLDRLRGAAGPLVQCSCPYVARRLASHGEAIASMMIACISPPVAAAEYLRAANAASRLHITFAGGCPSGSHESIDVWLSPSELMSVLGERGIAANSQPTEFDSVLSPDRRRFFSEPGGVPSRHALRGVGANVELVELKRPDFVLELAQQLLSPSRVLVDLALPLGCCCSGAIDSVTADAARARVREQEPPRALAPIVDHSVAFALDRSLPTVPLLAGDQSVAPLAVGTAAENQVTTSPPVSVVATDAIPRRRSPPGLSRPVLGTMPQARREPGRQLPRAYVARRRSSPRGLRESAVRSAEPTAMRQGSRWVLIGALGVAIGLGLAWVLRLLI